MSKTALALVTLAGLAYFGLRRATSMPGEPHRGPLPPLTPNEETVLAGLERTVQLLAVTIGPRHYMRPGSLERAAEALRNAFVDLGCEPVTHTYEIMGKPYDNIEVTLPGTERPEESVVIGAHYDSVPFSPGADDNASAVAALLELVRMFRDKPQPRTLRFVAFANEEPPFFMTADQGSRVYAKALRAKKERVSAMVCLESLGYFDDEPGRQKTPFPLGPFYPRSGDFVVFVGTLRASRLTRRCVAAFRAGAAFPCQGGVLPGLLPGVTWSDHRSFQKEGIPAVMVTDTAFYRNPHYHTRHDTAETLDLSRTARVVRGLAAVIEDLANGK